MKIHFKRTNFGAALLAVFLCMMIQLLILTGRDGGELHFESLFFFMNYLDGRNFFAQVMDPFRNDWGLYQARELSYLFDVLDTRFVAFLLKKHIVWFHSLCSLLLCGVMVFIQHYYTRKFFPKIPGMLVTLISVFFVLSMAVTGLNYFRCAKYLTATGLWGAFFAAYACCRWGNTRSRVALILSLFLMCLSDRQGFFFTAAFCGTMAVVMVWQSRCRSLLVVRRSRFVVLSAFAVMVFGIINNLYLTPALVKFLNGYEVDFAYQRDFQLSFASIRSGFLFLMGNGGNWFSSFTGDIRIASLTGALLLGGLGIELYCRYRKCENSWLYLSLLWLCALGAMLICGSAMAARHPMIMLADVVYGTYAINFLVITLFLLTLTAAGGKERFRKVLLTFVSAGILMRMGTEYLGERFAPEPQSFKGYYSGQHVLKEALRDPAFDEKRYIIPYRMELFLKFYREQVLKKQ